MFDLDWGKKYDKVCLVVGVGGHGTTVATEGVLKDTRTLYIYVIAPADDGGSTRIIGENWAQALKRLPDLGGSYNGGLKEFKPPISLGDDKQIYLAHILADIESGNSIFLRRGLSQNQISEIKKVIESTFNFRLKFDQSDPKNFLSKEQVKFKMTDQFKKLSSIFPLLGKYKDDFLHASNAFIDHMYENQAEAQLNGTSFMNLLLQTIYNCSDSIQVYKQEIHNLGFLPPNVSIQYLLDEPLILKGKCESGQVLENECKFDDLLGRDPVRPDSYQLFRTDVNDKICAINWDYIKENNTELVEMMDVFRDFAAQKRAYVLIPPGSLSNLMAVLNLFEDFIKETKVPIFRVLNAFIHHSEADLFAQFQDLYSRFNQQVLVLIGAKDNPSEILQQPENAALSLKYTAEGKVPADQKGVLELIEKNKINHTLFCYFVLVLRESIGLKYFPEQISEIINKVIQTIMTSETMDYNQEFANFLEYLGTQIEYFDRRNDYESRLKIENRLAIR